MVFLPLTFSWAIVRYRLMDTDLIFKRGVAYTLATGLLLGGYFGIIALTAEQVHSSYAFGGTGVGSGPGNSYCRRGCLRSPQAAHPGLGGSPLRPARYDYRKALVEFGRGLSSETDLHALLRSIVERLPRTLLVSRVAVFLADEPGRLRLAASHGLPRTPSGG